MGVRAETEGAGTAVRLGRVIAAIIVLAAALWYLTAPPRSADAYRERAAATAKTLRSQVQSARIVVESLGDDQLPRAAALVGLEEAERDAGSAANQFEAYEPPEGTLPVREELTGLASEAQGALGALRIAAQQDEWERLSRLAERLPTIAARLGAFQGQVAS